MSETARGRRLTGEELRTWRNYIETAETIRSMLSSRLQSESSLSPGDYQVLLALRESSESRLRSSELASTIGWERSRLSHHLSRMEQRGLINREECAEDNRGARVVLTAAGAEAFRRGSIPHLHAITDLFIDAYSPEQLAQVASLTHILRNHLDLDDQA